MLSTYERLSLILVTAFMFALPMENCAQKHPAEAATTPSAAPAPVSTPAPVTTVPSLGTAKDYLGDKTLERCRYFDTMKTVVEKIENGPPIEVNLSNYLSGKVPTDDTYRFDFVAYRAVNGNDWTMTFDGSAGLIPYHYTAYITNATTAYCKLTAGLDYTDLRTRLGCFADTTKITMASGEEKLIGLIQKGDMVLHPFTGRGIKVVEIIKGPEHNPMYEVMSDDHKVTVTRFHPFMTKSGLKTAKDLVVDDELLGADGYFHPLQGLNQLPLHDGQMVYNIRLDSGDLDALDHMVLADKVLTGDLFLQRQLQAGE